MGGARLLQRLNDSDAGFFYQIDLIESI